MTQNIANYSLPFIGPEGHYTSLQPDFRPGDKYKIVRRAADQEKGWGNYWSEFMTDALASSLHFEVPGYDNFPQNPALGIPLKIPAELLHPDRQSRAKDGFKVQCFPWFALEFVGRGNPDYDKHPDQLLGDIFDTLKLPVKGEIDIVEALVRAKTRATELAEIEALKYWRPVEKFSDFKVGDKLKLTYGVEGAKASTVSGSKIDDAVVEIVEVHTSLITTNHLDIRDNPSDRWRFHPDSFNAGIYHVHPSTPLTTREDKGEPSATETQPVYRYFRSEQNTSYRYRTVNGKYSEKKANSEIEWVRHNENADIFHNGGKWIIETDADGIDLPAKAPAHLSIKVGDRLVITVNSPWSAALSKGDVVKVVRAIHRDQDAKDGSEYNELTVEDANGYTWSLQSSGLGEKFDLHQGEITAPVDVDSTPERREIFIPTRRLGGKGWDSFDAVTGKLIEKNIENLQVGNINEIFDPNNHISRASSDIPYGCYYGIEATRRPEVKIEIDPSKRWRFNGSSLEPVDGNEGRKVGLTTVGDLLITGDRKVYSAK